ncbi:cbb3-type cytochrome oxidase assembly protein CcoS [Candidimonas sp. SYP-B2681]|nr:cbb3-type cytochrome oxidase assembly protein CcoS [Candidimonas sp. SYP-B2681]
MASSLFLLLPISLVFVIVIGVFFWWAIFAGQFDDSQAGGDSILLDNDTPEASSSERADANQKEGESRQPATGHSA